MEAATSGFLSRAASTKRVVREFRRVSKLNIIIINKIYRFTHVLDCI